MSFAAVVVIAVWNHSARIDLDKKNKKLSLFSQSELLAQKNASGV